METPGEQRSQQYLQGMVGGSATLRSSNHLLEAEDSPQVDSNAGAVPTSKSRATKGKRPMGGKCAKEEVKAVKQRKCVV